MRETFCKECGIPLFSGEYGRCSRCKNKNRWWEIRVKHSCGDESLYDAIGENSGEAMARILEHLRADQSSMFATISEISVIQLA